MNDHFKSNSKRKGGFPRKSDRELENFFPDTMKTATFSSDSSKYSAGYDGKNHYNQSYGSGSRYDSYDSYGQSSSSTYGYEKRGRGRGRRHEQTWADSRLYDDKTATGYKYTQPKEKLVDSYTVLNKTEPEKIKAPIPIKISSETFQTSSVSSSSKPAPPQKVQERNEKDVSKVIVMKPNGLSVNAPPVILSRSKTEPTGNSSTVPTILKSNNSVKPTIPSASYKISIMPPIANAITSKVVPEKEMTRVFRLFDDEFNLCDGHSCFNAYLLEQPNFLVVGVVGKQGVGKSMVASLLTGNKTKEGSLCFPVSCPRYGSGLPKNVLCTSHFTTGVDVFVTSERMIMLDFPAMLPDVIGRDGKMHSTVQSVNHSRGLEEEVILTALQYASLALSVCHCIVLVDDCASHAAHVYDTFQTAIMMEQQLKTEATGSDDDNYHHGTRQQPTFVMVRNKVNIDQSHLRLVQRHMSRQLGELDLLYHTGLSRAIDPRQRHSANFFTLPKIDKTENAAALDEVIALRRAVSGATRREFAAGPLNEKTWLTYVVREWVKIRKSRLFLDYSRLFP